MFDLKGRVAVVTGSTRGIGRSIALRLAAAGADIVVVGRDAVKADDVAREIRVFGRKKAISVVCDVSDSKQVAGLFERTMRTFGKIDILVNNAGIADSAPLTELTEEAWDRLIDTDLRGVFLCSQAAAREMRRVKYGKILNIASIAGAVGFTNIVHYCAAKGGVINMTKAMALELAPHGINVNAIGPGVIETDMTKEMISNPSSKLGLLSQIPLGRFGKPEDIAGAALFLVSDEASYVTGTTLFIDGGWLAR